MSSLTVQEAMLESLHDQQVSGFSSQNSQLRVKTMIDDGRSNDRTCTHHGLNMSIPAGRQKKDVSGATMIRALRMTLRMRKLSFNRMSTSPGSISARLVKNRN